MIRTAGRDMCDTVCSKSCAPSHRSGLGAFVVSGLPNQGDAMSAVRVTDDTPRSELEEAMHHVMASLHRMPLHWTERRAKLHAKLDALLEDWESASA